jgi:hypothetical protein
VTVVDDGVVVVVPLPLPVLPLPVLPALLLVEPPGTPEPSGFRISV